MLCHTHIARDIVYSCRKIIARAGRRAEEARRRGVSTARGSGGGGGGSEKNRKQIGDVCA